MLHHTHPHPAAAAVAANERVMLVVVVWGEELGGWEDLTKPPEKISFVLEIDIHLSFEKQNTRGITHLLRSVSHEPFVLFKAQILPTYCS